MTNKIAFLLPCLLQAFTAFSQPSHPSQALLAQSVQRLEAGDFQASREAAKAGLAALGMRGKKSLRAELNFQLAKVELEFGNFRTADSLLKLAAPPTKKSPLSPAAVQAWQGWSLIQQGQYSAADSMLAQALSLQKITPGENHPDYSRTLDWMGLSKFEQRKPSEADSFYLKAKALRSIYPGKTSLDYVISLDHLAEMYLEIENADQAQEACREALEAVGNHPYRSRLLNTLGRVLQLQADNLAAIDTLQFSLQLQEKQGTTQHPHYGKTLLNLGEAQSNLGRNEQAIASFKKAQAVFEKFVGEHPDLATVLNNHGDLLAQTGDEVEAAYLFERAAAIFLRFGQRDNYLKVLQNAATNLRGTEDHEQALDMFKRIVRDTAFYELPVYTRAFTLKNYAEALWMNNDSSRYFSADSLMRQAEQVFLLAYSPAFPDYLHIATARAEIMELSKNSGESAGYYAKICSLLVELLRRHYPLMNESERLFFGEEQLHYFPDFAQSFARRRPSAFPEANRALLELQAAAKGASLQTSLEQRLFQTALQDSSLTRISKQYQLVRQALTGILLNPGLGGVRQKYRLDSLENAALNLERQLSRRSAQLREVFGETERAVSFDKLRSALGQDEALVDFLSLNYFNPFTQKRGGKFYCALVCRSDSPFPQFVSLGRIGEVDSLLAQSETSDAGSYLNSFPVNRLLYQKVWQPLEPHLAGTKRVNVCPQGALHRLAFHALYSGQKRDTLLGGKFDIRYLLSPGDLLRRKPPAAEGNRSIALFGGAQFDTLKLEQAVDLLVFRGEEEDSTRGNHLFRYLPGTKREVEKIGEMCRQSQWEVQELTGTEASEQNFRKRCEQAPPSVIHIASHGIYFPRKTPRTAPPHPMEERIYSSEKSLVRSLVALSGANVSWKDTAEVAVETDGILTALEISNMDLSGVDLVVLSACQTARGDVQSEEGVFGLQRAFRLAGARSVLVSLWKVPDLKTEKLMTAFYQHYLAGKPAGEALREAQREMAGMYKAGDWAAFVLVE